MHIDAAAAAACLKSDYVVWLKLGQCKTPRLAHIMFISKHNNRYLIEKSSITVHFHMPITYEPYLSYAQLIASLSACMCTILYVERVSILKSYLGAHIYSCQHTILLFAQQRQTKCMKRQAFNRASHDDSNAKYNGNFKHFHTDIRQKAPTTCHQCSSCPPNTLPKYGILAISMFKSMCC